MTKEEITKEVGKPILLPLGLLSTLSLLTVIASPFVWIWADWRIALRIGLTGVLGIIVFSIIYNLAKKIIVKSVNDSMSSMDNVPKKSKFQERLEAMAKSKK